VLLRKLADQGTAIVFYSTDYDELIGCCDRVLVMYEGAIKRELAGEAITVNQAHDAVADGDRDDDDVVAGGRPRREDRGHGGHLDLH